MTGKHPAPRPALRPVGDRWEAAVPVASPVGAAWPRAADLISSGPVAVDPGPGTAEKTVSRPAPQPVAPDQGGAADRKEPKKTKKPKKDKQPRPAAAVTAPAPGKKDKKGKPKPDTGKKKPKAAGKPPKTAKQEKRRASAPLLGVPAAPAGPHPDRPLTVMLTPEQARRLQRQAREAGRAETHLVAELLDVWLEPR